jgi:hypothetical protein
MNEQNAQSRRNFLKAAAVGTAAVTINSGIGNVFGASTGPTQPSPLNKWPGRVAINFNKAATSNNNADPAVIMKMVDQTIQLLTGKEDVGEAWKSIFPDTLSATSKIAIKTVCYNPYKAGLHWSVAKGVVEGLKKMSIGGTAFSPGNITIFEMNTSMISNAFSVGGYTTTNFPDVNINDKKEPVDGGDGAFGKQYAKTLKEADFLINLFNARGHQLPTAGSKFTLGFKSHYGTYENPGAMASNNYLHASTWDKTFREIVCIGPVYKKLVLSVCGAIFGYNEGTGPGGLTSNDNSFDDFSAYAKAMDSTSSSKAQSTIIMSSDPVSAEMQAIKILRMNKANGKYSTADMPNYLKASAGIDVASLTPTYTIGIIDEAKMEIVKMVNDIAVTTLVDAAPSVDRSVRRANMSAHPINGRESVFINFNLPENIVGNDALIEIFNGHGALVRKLIHQVAGSNNQLSWDVRDNHGNHVVGGMYIVKIVCGITLLSAKVSIVQ